MWFITCLQFHSFICNVFLGRKYIWQCTWCLRAKMQFVWWTKLPLYPCQQCLGCTAPCPVSILQLISRSWSMSWGEGGMDKAHHLLLLWSFSAMYPNLITNIFIYFHVFLGVFKAQAVFSSVAAWLFIDIVPVMKEMAYRKWKIKICYLQYYKCRLSVVLYKLQTSRNGTECL